LSDVRELRTEKARPWFHHWRAGNM